MVCRKGRSGHHDQCEPNFNFFKRFPELAENRIRIHAQSYWVRFGVFIGETSFLNKIPSSGQMNFHIRRIMHL